MASDDEEASFAQASSEDHEASDDGEASDHDEAPSSKQRERASQRRPRKRIGSLATAARERGRVA